MFFKRIKNSYAAIFPSDGLLIILQEYKDNKQKIIEHDISKSPPGCSPDDMCEILYEAISKFDKTVAGVCIYINYYSDTYKNALIKMAKECGIENFNVIEECKIESFEVIWQLDIKLVNNKIIWTCLKNYCCIWNGLTCIIRRYNFNAQSFEGLLITTEFPPDIIIYESSCEKYFDSTFINELFPECEIFWGSHDKRNKKNAALNYINLLYADKSPSTPPIPKKIIQEKNNVLPKTIIHVGISLFLNTVSAVYFFNGKEREFTFKIDRSMISQIQHEQVEEMLKIAAKRVNGEFGCICIVHNFNYLTEFDQEWALSLGFAEAAIIDKGEAEYVEIISQLPHEITSSDIVWISSSLDNYEVWQNDLFQIDVRIAEMKNNPLAQQHFPNYVIFKDQSWKTYSEEGLKKQYPQCEFLFCNCQHTHKTAIRCAQMMTESTFNNTSTKEAEKTKAENATSAETVSNEHLKKRTIFEFPKQIKIKNDQIKATGIDLGTTRCCAAVNRKNATATVPLDNTGQRLLPSYVGYDEEMVKCGIVVLDRLRHFSKSTVFDSKRIIGRKFHEVEIDSNWTFRVSHENNKILIEVKKDNDSLKKTPEEVAADLLRHVKQKSEEFQGTKLSSVVITVPAAFTNDQKEATIRAARLSGWCNVTLLPEPVAASFAYFNERPIPNNSNVVVFDLGGGTLDVCIFEIKNNGINIISNTGDTKLGGRDFDNVLFNHFKNQLDTNHGITLIKDKKFKLILDCQKIKEILSTANIGILDVDEYSPEKHEIISITREEFQNITKPLLNRIRNTLLSALHDSKYKENEINRVLFVGGGSRMPMVRNLLLELFPNAEHCRDDNPDEVVAMGAAYYAYHQQQHSLYDEPPLYNNHEQVSAQNEEPPFHDPLKHPQQLNDEASGLSESLCALALFDYEQKEEDEIGFAVDDKITDIEQIDEGWWRGKLNGRTGLFPANYVKLI